MCLRFTNKSPARTMRCFMLATMFLVLSLAHALTPTWAAALPSTITGKADIVITNKQEAYYEGAVAQCKATVHLPDGSTQFTTGECISGEHYAVPLDGTYTYVGMLQPDGTYEIIIDSSTSPGANEGVFLPGTMWGTQKMGRIRLRYEPKVTITFAKTSASGSITSSNKEYSLVGACYDIFRSDNNKKVASITTDSNGKATLELEPNTNYYAVETKAPAGFKLDKNRIEFTTGSDASSVGMSDKAGTFVLSIKKKDSATGGNAQPGATLKGAEYYIVSNSTSGWEQTGTTDESGRLVIGSIPLGSITVTETKAPKGYKLDSTPHTFHVGADQLTPQGSFELEPVDDFTEHVIAFDIEITKAKDSGSEDSGIQQPAEGVEFQIISNTSNKTVGTIKTDKNGHATTAGKWFGEGERNEHIDGALPFDRKGYTVREVPSTTPEGFKPCPDWNITADQLVNGATLHYIVENTQLSSRIQVVKTDAENNQTVPLAGFTFQLLDSDKNPITQEVWTPNHDTRTEFTTDESGMVTFPQALKPGTYYIRETAAAAPYLLNGKDVKVAIEDTSEIEPITIVTVSDKQAMGAASIVKRCAFDNKALEGAEYDVVAQADIVSPSGAVQAAAGQTLDHVVTNEDGRAATKPLPLGQGTASFAFVETKAPAGHMLASEPIPFELTYENDHTELVRTEVEAHDAATRVHIEKTLSGTDEPLADVAFALWRKDDQISVDPRHDGSIALQSDDGLKIQVRRTVPYATVKLDALQNVSVKLERDGIEPITLTGEAQQIEPGSYRIRAEQDGASIDLGEATLEVKADRRYLVTLSSGLFGMKAHGKDDGPTEEPVTLSWNQNDRVYLASGLPSGLYEVSVDGKKVGSAQLGQGAWFGSWSGKELHAVPILLKPGKKPLNATTDTQGFAELRHLEPGVYRLKETSAPDGIVIDPTVRTFTVAADGSIEGDDLFNVPIENDYTKVEISKRDITNEHEVPGAKLSISDSHGNLIESWTSTDKPHRIDRLPAGAYTLTEEMTPHTYDKAQSVSFEVTPSGEVQTVVMYDRPLRVTGDVDKRQQIATPIAEDTEPNGDGLNRADAVNSADGSYSYTIDFRNTSSSWVDEFTVEDTLTGSEQGLAELVSLTTPVAREDYDGKLNVWYRTNADGDDNEVDGTANATLDDGHENPWLSDASNKEVLGTDGRRLDYHGWHLWAAGISTSKATALQVDDLNLENNEHVTAVRFEFGRVERGFTTRRKGWDRKDLKDPHDDISSTDADHGKDFAPAIMHMRASASYTQDTSLENSARVDMFRNGGGDDLEDHDEDYVVQRPKKVTRETLAQTNDPSQPILLAAMGLLFLGFGAMRIGSRADRQP